MVVFPLGESHGWELFPKTSSPNNFPNLGNKLISIKFIEFKKIGQERTVARWSLLIKLIEFLFNLIGLRNFLFSGMSNFYFPAGSLADFHFFELFSLFWNPGRWFRFWILSHRDQQLELHRIVTYSSIKILLKPEKVRHKNFSIL